MSAQADKVTLQTLAGVLSRHSPRIYTIKSPTAEMTPTTVDDDTTVFWLHDLVKYHGLVFNYSFLHDVPGIIRHFAANISGFVKYNPNSASTNAALIRCAAADGLIAAGTPGMVANLTKLGISQAADMSDSSPAEEFARSKSKLSRRGMVAQPNDGSKSQCLSSYAVFARIPTIEHGTCVKGFRTWCLRGRDLLRATLVAHAVRGALFAGATSRRFRPSSTTSTRANCLQHSGGPATTSMNSLRRSPWPGAWCTLQTSSTTSMCSRSCLPTPSPLR